MPNGIEEERVRNQRAPAERGRTELGHDAIAVRDQDGFASGREPDVLAELVFEQFDANRPHDKKAATSSYLVKAITTSHRASVLRPVPASARDIEL